MADTGRSTNMPHLETNSEWLLRTARAAGFAMAEGSLQENPSEAVRGARGIAGALERCVAWIMGRRSEAPLLPQQ